MPSVRLGDPINGQWFYALAWHHDTRGMRALLSVDDHGAENRGRWLHLSVSNLRGPHPVRWDWLSEARDLFMGDRLAIQVLPPREHWLNVSSSALHLYRCLDGETVPEIWDRMGDSDDAA